MEKEVNESRKAGGSAWVERELRKKTKDMFSSLHALLPQLPSKADHCTIVDEAVRYIKSLEHTLQTAQKQRLAKLRSSASSSITSKTEARSDAGVTRKAFLADHFQEEEDRPSKKLAYGNNPSPTSLDSQQASCFKTWFSPNIVVNICGNEAHVSVCSPRRPGLLSTVFYILEKHKLDVISAHISSDQHRCMYMIHAHYAGGACDDTLPAGALSVEDMHFQSSSRFATAKYKRFCQLLRASNNQSPPKQVVQWMGPKMTAHSDVNNETRAENS